jgi:aryl-alcohol dehydrogenase-like predicted oxidoreductase
LYVAVSDIPTWAFVRANTIAELRGWRYEIVMMICNDKISFKLYLLIMFSPFIGLQTRYNLLDRSLEFDLQPACAELNVCIIN